MTGLFYVLVAVGIVFVVLAYVHEEILIDFEDKLWAKVKQVIYKKGK